MKIVKYTGTSCTPCKMLGAFMNDAGLVVDETVTLGVDMEYDFANEKLGVMKTPTLVLVNDDGVEVDRVVGTEYGKVQELFAKRG